MTETWTLITGASEGIGRALAEVAAEHGRNLIISARSVERLEALAAQLRAAHGVAVAVTPADLADPAGPATLWSAASDGRRIDFLINNAGLGRGGAFLDGGWDRESASIAVNVSALTELTKLAAPHMVAAGEGRILNVASIAAYMPGGPGMAVYYATKAYVLSLSRGLADELKGTGVSVTALCPGVTKSNFFADADMLDVRLARMGGRSSPRDVAEAGYAAAMRRARTHVPGLINKIFAIAAWAGPGAATSAITKHLTGRG